MAKSVDKSRWISSDFYCIIYEAITPSRLRESSSAYEAITPSRLRESSSAYEAITHED